MIASETRELERAIGEIWEIAGRMGLDPYPVHFEMVPATIMYEFGAYGLPGRFSHWTHGRAYHRQKVMYDYGLSKIYELDRKSTRLNSSHANISYAVFCLKKKQIQYCTRTIIYPTNAHPSHPY